MAFDIPSAPPGKGPRAPQRRSHDEQRFLLGVIVAVLEEQSAYEVAALTGKKYTLPKTDIRGKVDEFLDASSRLIHLRGSQDPGAGDRQSRQLRPGS